MCQLSVLVKTVIFICCCFSIYPLGLAQSVRKRPIPKDWFQKDPSLDSVAGINLDKAYQLLKGRNSKTVIVAVIDNGVDILHEDLRHIIWTNKKEIPDNGIDDDHNGYVDDIHGWNFRGAKDGTIIENEWAAATQYYMEWQYKFGQIDIAKVQPAERRQYSMFLKAQKEYFEKLKSKDSIDIKYGYNQNYRSDILIVNDSVGAAGRYYGSPLYKLSPNLTHGTHVAGIIAAERNNGIGINGVADNVQIMPIVATTAFGDERDKDIANAIKYAVDNGAKIISMSFSKLYSSNKALVDDAIQYAEAKDVLVIHCAGNDGANIDSAENYHYPIAIYDNKKRAGNFITVGWSRPLFDYRLAHPYSDYGKLNVDLFAPGTDLVSTVPNNGYESKSGSSMSAPVVSGVAALLFSYFPHLSAKQVKEILMKSAFKPNLMVNKPQTTIKVPFSSLSVSGGIVNAFNAIAMAIKIAKPDNK